jgi:hypothetical protein
MLASAFKRRENPKRETRSRVSACARAAAAAAAAAAVAVADALASDTHRRTLSPLSGTGDGTAAAIVGTNIGRRGNADGSAMGVATGRAAASASTARGGWGNDACPLLWREGRSIDPAPPCLPSIDERALSKLRIGDGTNMGGGGADRSACMSGIHSTRRLAASAYPGDGSLDPVPWCSGTACEGV